MAKHSTASRSWTLPSLIVDGHVHSQTYTFTIGPLDYLGKPGDVYLHIPEMPARGAEGRPKYPEQAQWVRDMLAEHRIAAKEVWWSHWLFADTGEAQRFAKVLGEAGEAS